MRQTIHCNSNIVLKSKQLLKPRYFAYTIKSKSARIFFSNNNRIVNYTNKYRAWRRYAIIISLSAVGLTISNHQGKEQVALLSQSKHSHNIHEEELYHQKDDKYDLEEAHHRLLDNIRPKNYSTMVWFWLFVKRTVFLTWNFTPVILLAPFAYFNTFNLRSYWLQLMHDAFADSGATFIKVGQWISMRADIFPMEICEYLSNLRLKAPEHSFEETCEVIQESFGKPVDEIFERFYIEPCASGSIAQVYKAQIVTNPNECKNFYLEDELPELHEDYTLLQYVYHTHISHKKKLQKHCMPPIYQDVAVKVRHPRIITNMYIDITMIYLLSNIVSSLPGFLGMKFPIYQPEFTEYLRTQIDLKYESEALKKMRHNFKKSNEDHGIVQFPKVFDKLTTPSVLVESWEAGVPLSSLDLDILNFECRHRIAKQCYDVFMKMALRDNFVHGDCHSGNILIRGIDHDKDVKHAIPEPKRTSIFESLQTKLTEKFPELSNFLPIRNKTKFGSSPVIFLDTGLTVSLSDEGHERFGVMMGHIACGESEEAAHLFGEWAVDDEADRSTGEIIHSTTFINRKAQFVSHLADIIDTSLIWRYKDENDNPIRKKGIPFIDIGPLLKRVLILTQSQHILLDSQFSAVIASLGVIEGLIKSLDPAADFLAWGVPYLIRYRKLDALNYLLH